MAANYTDANGDLMIWTGTGYHRIPAILASDYGMQRAWIPEGSLTSQGTASTGQWEDRYGFDPNNYAAIMQKYGLSPDQNSLMWSPEGADSFSGVLKSGDKTGTQIQWKLDPATGRFVPSVTGSQEFDTNAAQAENNWAGILSALAMAGAGAGAAGAFGGTAGGVGGAGGTAATTAADAFALSDAVYGASAFPYAGEAAAAGIPASTATGLEAASWLPEAEAAISGVGSNAPLYGGVNGSAALSQLPAWSQIAELTKAGMPIGEALKNVASSSGWGSLLQGASKVLGANNGSGQSGTGSTIGGLLGGVLGYLDAKNQPNELRVKQEIDPALHDIIYGVNNSGGYAQDAYNLLKSQTGQPNPLVDAGKQISGMAGQLPAWSTLVDQSKAQWDSNPWVQSQQKAITDLTTRNLLENVLPNVNSGAMAAGGYGGSRQGIAQAKSISDMNTNLAPALANLASSAWESGQNRALAGAQGAANYGLNNQMQQANLLSSGANLQANGPWNSYKQFGGILSGLPGNQSNVQPLFTNVWGNTLGGAQLGSQVGGGTDWDEILKSIGGIAGGIGSLFGGK